MINSTGGGANKSTQARITVSANHTGSVVTEISGNGSSFAVSNTSSLATADAVEAKTIDVSWYCAPGVSQASGIYETLYNVSSVQNQTGENITLKCLVDTTNPSISQNSGSDNNTTVSRTWAFFNFSITDNFYIENQSFELTNSRNSTTLNYSLTREGTTSAYTINLSNLAAGNYTYVSYTNDSAGNAVRFPTNWFYSDLANPIVENITNKPNDTNDLDPNNTIVNVSVDISDDSQNITSLGVSRVVLEFSTNGTTIHNTSMSNESGNRRWATFTLNATGNWSYRIYANDTAGKVTRSNNTTLDVAYDRTWAINGTNLSVISALIGTNTKIAGIFVNNSGDYALNVVIAKDIAVVPTMSFNTSALNLSAKEMQSVDVNVTAPTTAGTYLISVKFTADNDTSAVPQANYSNGTFIAYGAGPYLYPVIDSANSTAQQGQTVSINVKVTNFGNETANNVWIYFNTSSDWSGINNNSLGTMSVNQVSWANVTFDVSTSASTGTKTVLIYLGFANYKNNQTSNATTNVVITAASTTTVISGGGVTNVGGGGGGGGASRPELLTTYETFEVVRNTSKIYLFFVKNIFNGSVMENVTLHFDGFLSQYVTSTPPMLTNIPAGAAGTFYLTIKSPPYLGRTEYPTNVSITGFLVYGQTADLIKEFHETRHINLLVVELSKEDANELVSKSRKIAQALVNSGFNAQEILKLIGQMEKQIGNREYGAVQKLSNIVLEYEKSAYDAHAIVEETKKRLENAESEGLDVSETKKLYNLALAALERGDFPTALQRAKDAQASLLLETKGRINVVWALTTYWHYILTAAIAGSFASFLVYQRIAARLRARKLEDLAKEEVTIIGLLGDTQKKFFVDKGMSATEFHKQMYNYDRRLTEIGKERAKLRAKRAKLVPISEQLNELDKEAEQILSMIKQAQLNYFKFRKISKETYDQQMAAYHAQLAQIEEQRATVELGQEEKKAKKEHALEKEAAEKKSFSERISEFFERKQGGQLRKGDLKERQPIIKTKKQPDIKPIFAQKEKPEEIGLLRRFVRWYLNKQRVSETEKILELKKKIEEAKRGGRLYQWGTKKE